MIAFHDALEDWAESSPGLDPAIPQVRFWDSLSECWRDAAPNVSAENVAAMYWDYLVLARPRKARSGDLAFFAVLG